ncbi:flavin-binding monooxygenase [Fusarium austroafricanum]|uniref:Flavin-binding monooxygenase n=1 Tax=Fusarium austroafricanum TaxID=2364996 RepID=A0A8H4P030_9HYPO|nr:flavin-binding monooxygenase [Fusarium austroafricanum]
MSMTTTGALAPKLVEMGPMAFIECVFIFTTTIGSGRGVARLTNVGSKKWKAWIVSTQLEKLNIHESSTTNGQKSDARPQTTEQPQVLIIGADFPTWLGKSDIVKWLEHYKNTLELQVNMGTTIRKLQYDASEHRWAIEIENENGVSMLRPRHLVQATGLVGHTPVQPSFLGESRFSGLMYHSSQHKSAANIPNLSQKKTFVVEFGTTGHDIAQDLVNHGAKSVTILQRSSTYVVSTDSVQKFVTAPYKSGNRMEDADLIGTSYPYPVFRSLAGGIEQAMTVNDEELLNGLEKAGVALKKGEDGTSFLDHALVSLGRYYIDQGACEMIIDGRIKVCRCEEGIKTFTETGVKLADGTHIDADIVILYTGYQGNSVDVRKVMGDELADKVGGEMFGKLDHEQEFKGFGYAMVKWLGDPPALVYQPPPETIPHKMPHTLLWDFINNYDLAFYTKVATLAEERCRQVLNENGIWTIVTSRAKRPDRLLPKLEKRHQEKNYQTMEDIQNDLIDLSGVRIALYFPSQQREVELLLAKVFTNVNVKRLAGHAGELTLAEKAGVGKIENYRNEFVGYRATHLRVQLGADSLPDDQQEYANSKIEIQIASILMHAWGEAHHDLAYKTFNGALSIDEIRMLDGINGLMRTGEVMLGQLKASMEIRIANETHSFTSHFELGAFVQQYIPHNIENERYRLGSLPWLLHVIQKLNIDSPRALAKALDSWKSDPVNLEKYPVVHSMTGYLFSSSKQRHNTISSPLFLPDLDEKFRDQTEAKQVSDICQILAYACDPEILGQLSLGGRDQQLRNAGYLSIDGPLKVTAKRVGDIKKQVVELWNHLANHELAEARLVLGIGRSRKAEHYWGKQPVRIFTSRL